MPGPKLLDLAAEALGEPGVCGGLPGGEGVGREPVALVEGGEEQLLVHLRRLDGEMEPVAVPHGPRGLVAKPRELADVVRDGCADGLRRLPSLTALGDVVARAQDPLDLVVVDRAASNLAAVLGEARLDGGLQLDDPMPERLGNLLWDETRVEEVELAANEPVCTGRPGGLDVAVEVAVRHRI